jgi:CheY-like chemotaxis protein
VRDGVGAPVGRSFVFQDLSQERELTTLKSDFLSTVTHELRTPLTSVKGSLQLVLGKCAALAPVERELLGISLKNADRLIRLINDLLDISRLELGNLDLTFAPIATGSMVHEAVAGLRAYAGGRDVVIGCDVEGDLPPVRGDRDRLLQVLTNLISNAVKFSSAGGRVVVQASRAGDAIAIAVRDWGPGIAESDRSRLFRRFQRLHPERTSEPGTGLGLAISKAIVDRHGGRIVVESREHEGSTFTVIVPAALEALRRTASAPGPAPDGRRPTILVVDDDVDLGTVLEASLGEGYRVLRVERGVQALDVARAERPDLILLDVVLPDLSGYDVLRILQHSESTGTIPIVMMTVQPEPTLASRLGAAEVLAKPVDIDHLRAVIERTLPADAGMSVTVDP